MKQRKAINPFTGIWVEEEPQRLANSNSLLLREIHIQITLNIPLNPSDWQNLKSCLMSDVVGTWESENVLLIKLTQLKSFCSTDCLVRQINHVYISDPVAPRYTFLRNCHSYMRDIHKHIYLSMVSEGTKLVSTILFMNIALKI